MPPELIHQSPAKAAVLQSFNPLYLSQMQELLFGAQSSLCAINKDLTSLQDARVHVPRANQQPKWGQGL